MVKKKKRRKIMKISNAKMDWRKAVVFLILLAALFLSVQGEDGIREAEASAVGIVSVSEGTMLNVRTGAGTNYAIVSSGGTKVTLSSGTKVTITGKLGDWYHVKFKLNAKTVKGYVSAKYVKVQTGSVTTKVYGKTNKACKIRVTPASSGEVLKINEKAVSVKSGTKVRVLSETLEGTKKWYRISVKVSGETCKGYIPSKAVGLTVGSGGIAGIVESAKTVSTYEDVANKKLAYSGTQKITLQNEEQVTILDDMLISNKKYLQVQFSFKGENVKVLVADAKVFLQIVKAETAVTATSKTTATPKPTATPKATATPKPTATPKTTVTPKPTATPKATATPKPVTDAQFKKNLESAGFPESYVTPLATLHKTYPLWSFVPYKTGLSWSTVIKNESKVGVNLLSNSKSYDWKSTESGAYDWKTDTFIPFDGSTWVTASEKAVKYYMDPRNFLDDRGIFQFESLEYQKSVHIQSGVETILKNTPMYQTKYTYTNDAGKSVSEKYAKTFMTAAEQSQVSPYHLAARVKQEVVISATLMSSSVSGNVAGYQGIYNFYNIGANNSTVAGGAIANGLKWASTGTTYLRPWNSRYKSIVGGSMYIGTNYINVGQNTLYLEKFNVTSKNRYNHQYMGNVEAPNSEATKTKAAYGSELSEIPLVFSIPVYEDMPAEPCDVPSGGKNPNNYLKTLKISEQAFDTKFVLGDDGSKTYTCTVPAETESVTVSATAVASTATVTGTGKKSLTGVAAGNAKTYTVKVTSESGNVRNYKIKVTKKAV